MKFRMEKEQKKKKKGKLNMKAIFIMVNSLKMVNLFTIMEIIMKVNLLME